MENPDIERKLSGRTLQVYLYIQRKREPSGIREIQRDLGLSSPSVADYQVEKLLDMGLVAKNIHGRVFITRRVKVRALESYVSFGRFSIPRLAFYASAFATVAILYIIFSASSISIYGIAVPVAAAAVLWAEAWRMWKFILTERTHDTIQSERRILFQMLVPGIVAAAIFAGAGAFLFQYSQQDSPLPVPTSAPGSESRISMEESVEISQQKVAAAGRTSSISELVLIGSIFAGVGVAGLFVYVATMHKRVLGSEQSIRIASGTQDYPSSLQ